MAESNDDLFFVHFEIHLLKDVADVSGYIGKRVIIYWPLELR